MRHQRIAVTALGLAALVAGAVVAAAPSQAGLVTSCTGTASDVTVPGELFVPEGESCELTNVTINGNTTVRADANLFLTNSTVNGTLTVMGNGFIDAEHTKVTGTSTFSTAFGGFIQDSTLTGNVSVTGPGFYFSVRSMQGGSITSTNGETYLESGQVATGINTTGDLLTDLYNTVVTGPVMVSGASLGSVVCASEVDGATSFTGGNTLQLGGTTPVSGCAFDVFAGNVTANGNADVHVVGNVIRGQLACADNASVTGSDNRIRGGATGQCATLTAAAAAAAKTTGKAVVVSTSRKSGLLTRIASRSNNGERAAKLAGPARIGS